MAMILRVVTDGEDATSGNSAGLAEDFEELPEGLAVESAGLAAKQKFAIPQTDCGDVEDQFAEWTKPNDTLRRLCAIT